MLSVLLAVCAVGGCVRDIGVAVIAHPECKVLDEKVEGLCNYYRCDFSCREEVAAAVGVVPVGDLWMHDECQNSVVARLGSGDVDDCRASMATIVDVTTAACVRQATQVRPRTYLYNASGGSLPDLLLATHLRYEDISILMYNRSDTWRSILFALSSYSTFNSSEVPTVTLVSEGYAYTHLLPVRRVVETRLPWWCDITLAHLFPIAVAYVMLIMSRRLYTHMQDSERVVLLTYLVRDVKRVFKSNLASVVFGVWIVYTWRYHVAHTGGCTLLSRTLLVLGIVCYIQSFLYPVFAFYIFVRGSTFMNRVRQRQSMSAFFFKQVDNAITTVQFFSYLLTNIFLWVTLSDPDPCESFAYQVLAIMITSYVFLTFACTVMVVNGASLADLLPSLIVRGAQSSADAAHAASTMVK